MRFSKLLIPTFKEAPKDVVLKSHEYLIRGGFIQQIGSGIYNFLPLGKRVLDKVRQIVKEEMDNAGANKLCIKRIMGHASADITDKVYTHKDLSELQKAISLLK